MIILLFENAANTVLSLVDKFQEKYPKSSIAYISSRVRTGSLAEFKKPPLFTNGWLLLCPPKIKREAVVAMDTDDNVVLIRVTSNAQKEEVIETLNGLDVRLVDNFNLDETVVITWVREQLDCPIALARKIYFKSKRRIGAVINAVSVLETVKPVTEAKINKYVEKQSRAGVNDVFRQIIGNPRRGVSKTDVMKVLEDYQYAMPWMYKFLIGQVDVYITIFREMLDGNLTQVNHEEYKSKCKNKTIAKLTEYQFNSVINQFGEISLEYLIYVRNQLAKVNAKDRLSVYWLIQIIKLGG